MGQKIYNFALIGHSGSGKTTLTAGLAATATENFSTQSDMLTKKYVNDINNKLLYASWPPPTSGEKTKLAFTVFGKKKCQISFYDYPGDMIKQDCFFKEIVRAHKGEWPDGALLLINCASEQLKDPVEAAAMQNDFKQIVTQLAEHKVPTALVITAWDRMPKEDEPGFDNFLKPITACMDQQLKKWKRFNVTATGPLADQEHPKLDPGGLEKPFLWLLDRYEKNGRTKIIKFIKVIIWLLIAALLSAGGLHWTLELKKLKNQNEKLTKDNTSLKEERDGLISEKKILEKQINEYKAQINSRKDQGKALNNKIASLKQSRDGLISEKKILEKQVEQYRKDEQKLLTDIKNMESKRDALNNEIASLKPRRDGLISEKKILEKQIEQYRKDEQKLLADIKNMESKRDALNNEIASLKTRYDKLSGECIKLQSIKDLSIKCDILQAKIDLLEKRELDDYQKDPRKILALWLKFERGAIPGEAGKIRKGDSRYDEVRKEYAESIAKHVFKYVADFNSIGEIKDAQEDKKAKNILNDLKKLCNAIERKKSEIPYLEKIKLSSFAEDFIAWSDMQIKVTVYCNAHKGDEKCTGVKLYFSRVKEITENDSWKHGENAGKSDPKEVEDSIQIKLSHPYNGIEYHFGIITECPWKNGQGGFRYYFNPAKDGSAIYESKPGFIRMGGFVVKFKAVSDSEQKNGLPVRLLDLLQIRYGGTAEKLCEKDNND